jgi:ribonuclease III
MEQGQITPLELRLGYTFLNKDLLITALTHKTFAFEAPTPLEFNERLEFLGDSILNFIVAEQLYSSNKYFSEGELTRRRAIGVNNKLLADVAKQLGIGEFLFLGRGEQKQGGSANQSNLANAVEAVIGAIYLDSGLEAAREFIMQKIFTADFFF